MATASGGRGARMGLRGREADLYDSLPEKKKASFAEMVQRGANSGGAQLSWAEMPEGLKKEIMARQELKKKNANMLTYLRHRWGRTEGALLILDKKDRRDLEGDDIGGCPSGVSGSGDRGEGGSVYTDD